MSSQNSAQDSKNDNTSAPSGSGGPPSKSAIQQKQIQELTARFKQLVTEAKKVGETTPRGKELLLQAAKLKAVYENYTRRQQALARAQQLQQQGSNTNAAASSGSSTTGTTGTANSSGSASTSGNNSSNSSAQLANIIKQVLTPEQNQQYEQLLQNFQVRASAIKDKHTFIKQNIDRLVVEINKQTDEEAKKQLNEKKTELLRNIKAIRLEHQALQQELQNGKKNFYLECARQNPALQRLLQRSTQQQRMMQQKKQPQPAQPQVQSQAMPGAQSQANANGQAAIPQSVGEAPPTNMGQQQMPTTATGANISTPSGQQPVQGNTQDPKTQIKTEVGTPAAGSQKGGRPAQPQQTPSGRGQTASQQSPVTGVNAAASSAGSSTVTKSSIFKPSDPTVPIADTVSVKPPEPIAFRSNRPTISDGSAMNAAALNTPVMTTLPPYEIDTDRVMSKRKLRELVKSIGIDEGDGETVIDGDVEELLLDLADDFVTNVTGFACRLAKHRKSDNLEPTDIQLHLERNWNIRIPGYSADEIRSVHKWNASPAYAQKLTSINADKQAISTASANAVSNKKKPANFQK